MKQFNIDEVQPWGKDLIEKYPLIFLEPDPQNVAWHKQTGEPQESYVNLRFGFEHHEGWKELVEKIAKTGSELVTHIRATGIPDEEAYIHSCIVKEKFGGLNWQGSFKLPNLFRELWWAYLDSVKTESYSVCEMTGKHGHLRRSKGGKGGCWVRTLCTEEAIKNGYDLEDWEIAKVSKQEHQKPETD